MKQNLVLFTLVNLGIGYYRIGFLEESLVCLENCLVSLKNPSEKTKCHPIAKRKARIQWIMFFPLKASFLVNWIETNT